MHEHGGSGQHHPHLLAGSGGSRGRVVVISPRRLHRLHRLHRLRRRLPRRLRLCLLLLICNQLLAAPLGSLPLRKLLLVPLVLLLRLLRLQRLLLRLRRLDGRVWWIW